MSNSGSMDTQARINHLQEMGVSQWHARFVLVGAAASPDIISVKAKIPQEIKAAPSLADKDRSESVLKPVLGSEETVGALLEEMSVSTPVLPSYQVETGAASTEKAQETSVNVVERSEVTQGAIKPIPNVSLGAFVSGKYLVISEIGEHASHLEEMSLLKNILNVVDFKCPDFQFGGHFSWPVFKSEKVLVGQELLHEELLGKWLESFELAQDKVLLCFGNQAKQMMVHLRDDASVKLADGHCIFFGDSLTALYNAPLRKKDLWNVLSGSLGKFK